MSYLPLSEAKDKLSSLVEEAISTHEIIHITKHGRPGVVLMAEEDLESLHETIFWLSQPGIHESIAAAREEAAAGRTIPAEQLRKEFGLPT